MTAAKISVPELSSVSPRFAAAVAKVKQVEDRLAELDARIASTQERLQGLPASDADALALLAASDMDAAATGGQAALIDEVNRLAGDRRTARRALDMAVLELRAARGEASTSICRDLLPEYRRRVDALARALLAAHEAHRDLEALTDALDALDIGWPGTLPPMQIRFLGDVARDGLLPGWIIEARARGLTSAELPAAWVRAWASRP